MSVKQKRSRAMLGAMLGGMVLCFSSVSAAQPTPANLEGVWQIATPTTSLKPIAGDVPFTTVGRKAYEANKKLKAQRKFDEYDITLSRCSNPGIPRLALSPMRFKIWDRQGVVTFDYEWNRALRQINVSVPPQPDLMGQNLVPTMTGKSKGRWEGDTLISVMEGASDRTLIDDLIPHGYDLKVTEHYTLIDANTLENRIIVEDPEFFSRPWEAVVTYKRQPDAIFPEDVCLDRLAAKQPAFPQ